MSGSGEWMAKIWERSELLYQPSTVVITNTTDPAATFLKTEKEPWFWGPLLCLRALCSSLLSGTLPCEFCLPCFLRTHNSGYSAQGDYQVLSGIFLPMLQPGNSLGTKLGLSQGSPLLFLFSEGLLPQVSCVQWLKTITPCLFSQFFKNGTFHRSACHPCTGAMLISASFQFQYICCPSEHLFLDFKWKE